MAKQFKMFECPGCGEFHQLEFKSGSDLREFVQDLDDDYLYEDGEGTLCPTCSAERRLTD